MGDTAEDLRVRLAAQLRSRRSEIEQATMTRVYGVSDAIETAEPEYAEGLRAAVSAALDFAFDAIELGEQRSPPIPAPLLTQARLAARSAVPLDTVLRRYFAGYTLLGDLLIEEADDGGLLRGRAAFKSVLRTQAAVFDRLVAAVAEEFMREAGHRSTATTAQRRAERVERLLEGELLDTSDLEYDFEAQHLGVIAVGPGAEDAIRSLARLLDRSVLIIRHDEDSIWAWLGTRRSMDQGDLQELLPEAWPDRVSAAVGEPASGLTGWRLTHWQARAALPIALRRSGRFACYRDVALLASVIQDDLLCASLRWLYLAPLEQEPDGGEAARQTLRAYFSADRNVSSAAAALGVKRHTVTNRLRTIETVIGHSLKDCETAMHIALCLHDLAPSSTAALSYKLQSVPELKTPHAPAMRRHPATHG